MKEVVAQKPENELELFMVRQQLNEITTSKMWKALVFFANQL